MLAIKAYIDLHGTPPLRRDGASAKPLTVYSVNEHPAMSDVRVSAALPSLASPARGGGKGGGRRGRKVPGCLTGESEERETWTAESCGPLPRSGKPVAEMAGRDFGGRRFRSTLWILRSSRFAGNKVGPRQTL